MVKLSNTFPLSYSRISTFKNCPRQFEYLNITKDVAFQESDESRYGKRVHKQLEKYGKTGDVKHLTIETRKWKALIDTLRARPGTKEWEQQVALDENGLEVSWFSKEARMRAIYDQATIEGDTAYVFDWKTGKVREDLLQLMLFACTMMEKEPTVNKVKAAFIWLPHNQITDIEYHRDSLDAMWAKVNKHGEVIQEAIDIGVFIAKPSPLCGWCAAKDICSDRFRR